MAKAPAKDEPESVAEAPPKRGKKLLIILLVVVLLLAVVAGGVIYLMVNRKHAEAENAAHADEPPKVTVDRSKPPTFMPLDAFTVNLQPGEGDHYLQAVIVLKVSEPHVTEDLKAYMPEIRHRVNLLLSSKKPSEVATIEGRELLADEIMVETNYVLGYEPPKKRSRSGGDGEPWGPVLAVLFNSFIIQ